MNLYQVYTNHKFLRKIIQDGDFDVQIINYMYPIQIWVEKKPHNLWVLL